MEVETFKTRSLGKGSNYGEKGGEKTARLGRSRKFQNQRFEYW